MAAGSLKTTFVKGVALPGLIIIIGVVLLCGIFPDAASEALQSAQTWIVSNMGWSYVLMFAIYIIFLVVLAVSNLGNIRLGSDYTKPKYSLFTWVSMLFAAGMGVGLMFFGVAETISHYATPALTGLNTVERAKYAQAFSFFHWGLHGWAVYALVALALAYFRYRYKLALAIRSAFYPLLKNRIYGVAGDVIDVFALCSTVFGITTTLGFGALQLSAGLNNLGLTDGTGFGYQAAIVCVFLALALASALSGVDKGVKRLSELNMILAVLLLAFLLCVGPTRYIIGTFSEGIGFYLSKLVYMTFNTYAYEPDSQTWFSDWTIFYWAWWIAWAPFVGLFIARISKGRTIREFVIGVILVPSVFNFFWMTVFGSSAVWIDQHEAAGALSGLSDQIELLLFRFLDYLPFASALKGISMLIICVFFVTSADSGILVMNSIASGGAQESRKWQTTFWAVLLGLLAITLMRSGGLGAVQTLTLISALPFGVILLLMCISLWQALHTDMLFRETEYAHGSQAWRGKAWRDNLDQILSFQTRHDVQEFMDDDVAGAFEEFRKELATRDIEAVINRGKDAKGSYIELQVPYSKLRNFTYGVFAEPKNISEYFNNEENAPDVDMDRTYIPLTYFNDGRTGYDIQYLSRDEILADILREYGRFIDIVSIENEDILPMTMKRRRTIAPRGDQPEEQEAPGPASDHEDEEAAAGKATS